MCARITIDVGAGPLEVTVRAVGECTCAAVGDVHEPGCGIRSPDRIDLVIAEPVRAR